MDKPKECDTCPHYKEPDEKGIIATGATPVLAWIIEKLRSLKRVKDKMDVCVRCGKETPYLKSTHIDQREYYIEGAGQLCKDCFNEVYWRLI